MYGCWVLPINYEEYNKREDEIDGILKGFGEDDFSCGEEFEPLEAAYLIELTMEEEEYEGHYVAVVGDSHFNEEKLCSVVFGLEKEYTKYNELKGRDFKKLTDEEKMKLASLALRYPMLEGSEIEELEELLDGEEVSCGKIVKRIF